MIFYSTDEEFVPPRVDFRRLIIRMVMTFGILLTVYLVTKQPELVSKSSLVIFMISYSKDIIYY